MSLANLSFCLNLGKSFIEINSHDYGAIWYKLTSQKHTLNLLTFADTKTNRKAKLKNRRKFLCPVSGIRCHMSGVRCQTPCVTCWVSPVTCNISLTPTATATDPPIITPSLCTVGWLTKTQIQTKKIRSMSILAFNFHLIIKYMCKYSCELVLDILSQLSQQIFVGSRYTVFTFEKTFNIF